MTQQTFDVLSPWAETDPQPLRGITPRLSELRGKRIGLFANYKRAAAPIQDAVEGIVYSNRTTMLRQQLAASGIAVRVGLVPNTQWLDDVVDLDTQQRILVNADLETSAAHILACGDIRSGARATVATAVGDGAAAAARASELLREGDRS